MSNGFRPIPSNASWELLSGLIGFILLASVSLLAPLFLPLTPYEQFDPAAGRHLPPGSIRHVVQLRDGRTLLAERVEVRAGSLRATRLSEGILIPFADLESGNPNAVTRRTFVLGTDRYGRDVASRLIAGGRVSLAVGVLSAILALFLGTAVGATAALLGGLVDSFLMRATDGFLAFPRLFLVLGVAALADSSAWVLIAILGGTGWMGLARLARAGVRTGSAAPHVIAARGLGLPPWRVLVLHNLPHTMTPLLVEATLRAGELILLESALSFLGVGIHPPTPSWGAMIAGGASSLTTAWWVSLFPGLALTWTVLTLSLVGDGLRDRVDVRPTENPIESDGRPPTTLEPDAHLRFPLRPARQPDRPASG